MIGILTPFSAKLKQGYSNATELYNMFSFLQHAPQLSALTIVHTASGWIPEQDATLASAVQDQVCSRCYQSSCLYTVSTWFSAA